MEPDTPFEQERRREEHEVDETVKHKIEDVKHHVDEDQRKMADEGVGVEEYLGNQPGGGTDTGHS